MQDLARKIIINVQNASGNFSPIIKTSDKNSYFKKFKKKSSKVSDFKNKKIINFINQFI